MVGYGEFLTFLFHTNIANFSFSAPIGEFKKLNFHFMITKKKCRTGKLRAKNSFLYRAATGGGVKKSDSDGS